MTVRLSHQDETDLRAIEDGLWRAQTRNDLAWMERALADDFQEIGASGRVHDRAATLAPHPGPIDSRPLRDWRARAIAPGLAMTSYVSETVSPDGRIRRALRTSLWRREEIGWRLMFHQGTLAPED